MFKVFSKIFFVSFLLISWFPEINGQPVLPTDLKKPKKYENKLLGAEKSADKKFGLKRKFIQNTVTHYNWFFNANNKLNEVIERAKLANRDDYGDLLPFYNYSLEKTSAEKTELDSVIFKANTGILIHDLRNNWMDNLFMLIGKAYYLKNDLDSAYITFQYINYAFSPKDDGYDLPIGSNANEGGNNLSVASKENSKLVHRFFTTPPDRNESFIWQIRTWIQKDYMPEAASLIQTLRNDLAFPERLQNDLNEVHAFWFYHENRYDSAAYYLEKALGNAQNKKETSRWEYLIAQLYELSKRREDAIVFYNRAIKHTLDPVLEVHARLNAIRQNKSDSNAIKKNIAQLVKMGRRDRYVRYRDIVYFTAAQIELERDNVPGAKAMLLKSTTASADNQNPGQRTRSFLLLADLYFQDKQFGEAKRYYDSVNSNDLGVRDPAALDQRKEILQQLVMQTDIIHRQDSLQLLAAMPAAQRDALLKKIVRQLRKKQGLKEDEQQGSNAAVGLNNRNAPPADLFESNAKGGDWYFSNPSIKSKGFTTFKSVWGNRPNVDNWRRQSAISQNANAPRGNRLNQEDAKAPDSAENQISVAALLKGIPLTPDKMQLSKDSIGNATLELGILHINKLEEYPAAIVYLEKFIDSFEYSSRVPEAMYYLYFAYLKTGKSQMAGEMRTLMTRKFAGSPFEVKLNEAISGKGSKTKEEATKEYDKIYNLFIEGDFEQALARKAVSDSTYGTEYWTPQLLYIQGIYHIHKKEDQKARAVLQKIVELYPNEPLAKKVQTLLDVLARRKEIEDYLTKLEIKRVEDTVFVAKEPPPVPKNPPGKLVQDSTTLRPVNPNPYLLKPKADTAVAKGVDSTKIRPAPASEYSYNPETPHDVVLILNKVDPVYVTESRNAFNRYNKEKYFNQPIEITHESIDDTTKLVIMSGFANAAAALDYLVNTKPVAATQIVPWLPANKYSIYVISPENVEVLKNKKDLDEYRKFHERYTNGARPEPH